MQAFRNITSTPVAAGARWLALAALALLALPGCSDRTADLQQQITSLQNELERAHAEAAAAQKQLAEATPPSSETAGRSGGGTVSREEIERSYEEAARVFRSGLESQMPEAQLGNFTLYKPQVEEFPHRSEFSMEVRLRGKPVQIDRIPVKAGLDGKWTFPTVAEVGALIERLKSAPPSILNTTSIAPDSSAASTASASAPAVRTESSIAAPAASNQTVVVQWGDAPASPPAASPQAPPPPARSYAPAPPPPGAPREPAGPTKVMPASRDVQIKF